MPEPREKSRKKELLGKYEDFTFWLHKKIGKSDGTLGRVAEAYEAVFNMQGEGEWGESWSKADALAMLKKDFFERSKLKPVLVTMEKAGKVDGFSIGYALGKDQLSKAEMPYELEGARKEELLNEVKELLGDEDQESIFFFKELGIRGESRGGFEKVHILFKSLIKQAEALGTKKVLFWTSRSSRLYKIVKGLGAQEIVDTHDKKDDVFLVADVDFASQVLSLPTEVLVAALAKKQK